MLDWFHLRRALYLALRGAAVELDDDYVAAAHMTFKNLLWYGEIDLALERLSRLRGRLAVLNHKLCSAICTGAFFPPLAPSDLFLNSALSISQLPSFRHRLKYPYTVCQAGKSCGNIRHAHPLRST